PLARVRFLVERGEPQTYLLPLRLKRGKPALFDSRFVRGAASALQQILCLPQLLKSKVHLPGVDSSRGALKTVFRHGCEGCESLVCNWLVFDRLFEAGNLSFDLRSCGVLRNR